MIFITMRLGVTASELHEEWGLIPSFLSESDPRPAREQFDASYIGGWHPQDGFKRNDKSMALTYPGDPPMKPLSICLFRGERIYLYPYAYVCIVQPDGKFEVSRMD